MLTTAVLVIMGCLAGSGVGAWVMWKLGQVEVRDVDVAELPAGEPMNVLLVGSDSREGDNAEFTGGDSGRRADTIMVLRIDPETDAASVISFPRDLMLTIANTGDRARINSAYNEGDQVLIETLTQNFGIAIHRYVVIDFVGFQRMVDAVGGVPMYFERQVMDSNTGLGDRGPIGPGCVVLDGHQGLAYARSRSLQYKNDSGEWSDKDGRADLGRIDRQRIFMEVALGKVLADVKANPGRLFEILTIGIDTVAVDEGTKEEFLGLANDLKDFKLENLETYALPTDPDPENPGATVVTAEARAEPILNIFRGLDPSDIAPGGVMVQVMNGTEVEGQALNVAAALQTVGFKIGERGDAIDPPAQTTIYHPSGEDSRALRVARHVTGGAVLAVDDSLPSGTVRLVTGPDFTTIHQDPTPLEQMSGATPPPSTPTEGSTPPETPPTTAQPVVPVEEEESSWTLGGPCP